MRPERRRAVDEDEVEVVHHGVDGPLQLHLPAEGRHQLDLDPGQVDGRGRHEEILDAGRLDAVLQGLVPHDDVVHGELEVAGVDAQAGRGVALGIEVDDQDPVPDLGQGGPEVDGRRGLAHPALLVRDGDHPGQLTGRPVRPVEQLVGVSRMVGARMVGSSPSGGLRRLRPSCPPFVFLAISTSGPPITSIVGGEVTILSPQAFGWDRPGGAELRLGPPKSWLRRRFSGRQGDLGRRLGRSEEESGEGAGT